MGMCFSRCFIKHLRVKDKNLCYQTMNVFPFPCEENVITPSEKNDEKFYFIKHEKAIDVNISRLDELPELTEKDVISLEQTMLELKNLKNAYAPTVPISSMDDDFTMVTAGTEEIKDEGMFNVKKIRSRLLTRPSTFVDRNSFKQGELIFEIQKGNFLHSKVLEKYQLRDPYVVIKIYLTSNKGVVQLKDPKTWIEIKAFQTLRSTSLHKPEWDQVFEHCFEDPAKIPKHVIGISLFYTSEYDHTAFQVGEEQTFSVSSLFDQKVQHKQIDFKDPVLKGVLAQLGVRFQLLHNIEELRRRNLKDISARLEKLVKIKKRYKVKNGGRSGYGNSSNSSCITVSPDESPGSGSSTHENEESIYYVK